ncbi:MAG: oxidoreductase [Candidatus Melainabacteria bacterium]|nr:MAG: oxidoreductase [Candidatus Melainabacteria bacterium]
MAKLTGKVALITGGTTGIGYATAELFKKEGAQVAITGQNPERVKAAQERLGKEVLAIQSDTSKIQDIETLATKVKERFGRVDILFANAGIGKFVPIEQVTPEHFDELFDTNVRGLFFTIQKILPLMGKNGSIILNASVAGSKGMESTSVYSATKAAVRSLGRTLAAELAPKGIRVNTVSPGPIETPIFGKLGIEKSQIDAMAKEMESMVALKRIGQPEEVATTLLFFASNDSSYVVGAELYVDGGLAAL